VLKRGYIKGMADMRRAIVERFEGMLGEGLMNGRTAAEIARLVKTLQPRL
jgi:hypothetical protein